MFKQTFGKVTLQTVSEPKRGFCLEASLNEETRILMDVCGMMIPDGINAYFFGNKLILVTRWGNMTEQEIECAQNGTIVLAIHPSEIIQFSMKLGENWGDVMLTLPHCYKDYNDENAPVDEIIFVFTDRYDADDFMIARSLVLPPFLQKRLQKAMVASHKKINLDQLMPSIRRASQQDEEKDAWDYIYDECWSVIAPYHREATQKNFDIPDGTYIEIGPDNKIKNILQNQAKAEPAMSDEVRFYLDLATKGSVEAEYNLGVCFEHGDGVEQDYERAVYWYKRAADRGYDKAQFNLGVCYTNGYGVDKDEEEAVRLYALAAEQGNMYAAFNAAVCYLQGIGVDCDFMKGLSYMRQAAEKGHAKAREFLHLD